MWWRETESDQILILSAINENSQEVLDAKKRELNSLITMGLTVFKIMVKTVFHANESLQRNKRRMEVSC